MYMRFESSQPIEKNSRLFEVGIMNDLIRKSKETQDKHRISLEPFIEVYGLDKVKKDYASVAEKISQRGAAELTHIEKVGFIFERAFLDLAASHQWFGPRSEIGPSSWVDDELGGIDLIATVMNQSNVARHFQIASDLTISYPQMTQKINRLKQNVFNGELATINYYHSELMGFTGRLTDVPRTVVSLEIENIKRFLTTWQQEPEQAQEQFALVMLKQIAAQCSGFAKYASNIHGPGSRIVDRYQQAEAVAQEIIDSKKNVPEIEDKTLQAIVNMSERMAHE